MPSERLKKFVDADYKEKEGKKEKEELKPYIKRLVKKATGMGISIQGVSFYVRENIVMNEDEIFEYVKGLCMEPELDTTGEILLDENLNPIYKLNEAKFNKFCKQTIDLERLALVAKELNIEALPLPSFCYNVQESEVIKVDHKKIGS